MPSISIASVRILEEATSVVKSVMVAPTGISRTRWKGGYHEQTTSYSRQHDLSSSQEEVLWTLLAYN